MSLSHLKRKILRDPYNALIFKRGEGSDLYLIGGYVRDTLMRRAAQDRDYILRGDLRLFVHGIRTITGGTIIEFKKGETIRLALSDGTTFDFSRPRGCVENDLRQRDFTMNALAWSPDTGLIDVTGGVSDINKMIIRGISQENFKADPLRMIRAYRFAGEIGGTIDKTTRTYIKRLHDNISSISSERITLELFYLLNSSHASGYLKQALDDYILSHIFPFPYNTLSRNIRDIFKLERSILEVSRHTIKVLLQNHFSQNLTYKGLLCLEILQKNYDISEKIQMSRRILKRLYFFNKARAYMNRRKKGAETLFNLFMLVKDASVDTFIIGNRMDLMNEYGRFQSIWRKGIISSEEIIEFSGIKTGHGISEIIASIRKAQFMGLIRTKKQAKELTKKFSNGFIKQ